MTVLKWLLVGMVAIVVLAVLAGQLGFLGGQPPADLGVREGKLKAPPKTPNSVSSQAALWPGHDGAVIAPLAPVGDLAATMARLKTLAEAMPGARVVEARPDYLYVQFTTRLMKFVDDAEFWADPAANVVQVRSASRLGESDLGANRARIEALRERLSAVR